MRQDLLKLAAGAAIPLPAVQSTAAQINSVPVVSDLASILSETQMIINLFGGPCSGKSTLALGLGHELKKRGCEAAVITEEAKPWACQITPAGQLQIMNDQYIAESKYYGLADFIITDSPLELAGYYSDGHSYRQIVSQLRKNSPLRKNFWLERTKPYEPEGRFETEEQAHKVDVELTRYLAELLVTTSIETHDPSEFIERYILNSESYT